MDITVNLEDYKLNVRTAGVIIHNNKVLLHRNTNENHYALMGGRIAIGENSADAVKREYKEELGKDVDIIGYVSTVENFFENKGSKYHEIMFVYQLEFLNEEYKKIEHDLKNIEGKDYLKYEWVDIDKIDEYHLTPEIMKGILKEKVFPPHVIYDELN